LEERSRDLSLSEAERMASQIELTDLYSSLKSTTERYNASLANLIRLEARDRIKTNWLLGIVLVFIGFLVLKVVHTIKMIKLGQFSLRRLWEIWL